MVGIYKITNTKNGKVYIGQSVSIATRINNHKRDLRNNNHINCYLQDDYNIYGEDSFTFETIYRCRSVYLDQAEKFYIDKYSATDRKHGYNATPGCGKSMKAERWIKQKPFYDPSQIIDYYRDKEGKIVYNDLCIDCKRDCKQSFRAEILICPKIEWKR